MDILSLIGNERRYNFHSHTEFCDGRAQMQAFAAKAVELGFRHYGFSPHSPIPIESPCNMAKSTFAPNLARFLIIHDFVMDGNHLFLKNS